jgi:opacity protein-like surface antigen
VKAKLFILLFFALLICGAVRADDAATGNTSGTWRDHVKELGIMTGYGASGLPTQDDYRVLPLYLHVGIDMDKLKLGYCDWIEKAAKSWFHKDFHPKGYTEFVMEPFVSYVPSPNTNMEVGFVLLSKFAYPLTPKIHPYIFGGGGVMYITQHLHNQATQYNFTPQIGAGVSYLLKDDFAVNCEYRWRHFSNAHLKEPNDGVNVDLILVGVSWFFS